MMKKIVEPNNECLEYFLEKGDISLLNLYRAGKLLFFLNNISSFCSIDILFFSCSLKLTIFFLVDYSASRYLSSFLKDNLFLKIKLSVNKTYSLTKYMYFTVTVSYVSVHCDFSLDSRQLSKNCLRN